MKVLWLASWFPSRTDLFNGDFIERHAFATAPFTETLFLIAIVKDEAVAGGGTEIIKKQSGNLITYTGYYGKSRFSIAEKLFSFTKYFLLQRKIYRQIKTEYGPPDIVHVHVPMNAGVFALYLKKLKNVQYIVTEHWARYTREARPNIYEMSKYFTGLSKKILKNAALFLPVSNDLGKCINENFIKVKYKVIPNVVDTNLFFYQPVALPKFRFIHASYMHYQKNPEGILQACKILKEKGVSFELLMLGSRNEKVQSIARQFGLLGNFVFFQDAVPYAEVAKGMQQSSALLLFSRFENLPCVMLEALCCGLPVISSNVGGIAEVIDDSNGILVESENIDQLAEAMETMISEYARFNREHISSAAGSLFNYNKVGKEHMDVYRQVLTKSV